MKVIFLDIDGVLNCNGFGKTDDERYGFFQPFVNNLKNLLVQTGAKVVISSSWRLIDIMDHISKERPWIEVLEEKLEMPGIVIGKIGYLNEYPKIYFKGENCSIEPVPGKGRADDIKDWLDAHQEIGKFVILDDAVSCDNISEMFPEKYVDCSLTAGFRERSFEKAIKILES